MIVNRLSGKILLQTRILMKFSGGHHHQVYDWRDDHAQNPDFYEDPRMIGVRRGDTFVTPYKQNPEERPTFKLAFTNDYDQKDLTTNMVGYAGFSEIRNNVETPQSDYINDAAHEFDYESEDLDFQPESFESQHFRKQGPLWMWIIACTTPLWFFANELFTQYWPDADNWRYQRPPPMNYPSTDETNDDAYIRMFKSIGQRQLYDAGVANAPFYEVVDGKKVYTKWAGVNQPRDAF